MTRYALFARVPPTLEGLRIALAEFVRAAGRELVADQEQQKASVVYETCVFVCADGWVDGCRWTRRGGQEYSRRAHRTNERRIRRRPD